MYAWFTVPTAANVIASSSEYASSVTTEFLPLLYLAVGIMAAVMLIKYLRGRLNGGIKNVAGGRRGRGRRR